MAPTTKIAGIASAAALAVVVGVFAIPQAQGAPDAASAGRPTASATSTTTTAELAALLQFNRDEERMARDLYQALADVYDGAQPFSMITRSEQMHYSAIGTLLDRYGISDPSVGKAPGMYASTAVQELYDRWLREGKVSLQAAYAVGIELEKRDIADLDATLAKVTQADVRRVLTNLKAASENHLAAFEAAAAGKTVTGQMGSGQMGSGQMGPGRMGGMMGSGARNGQGQGQGSGPGNGNGNGTGRWGSGRNGADADGGCPMM